MRHSACWEMYGPHSATREGQRHLHLHVAVIDLAVVDEPQINDVYRDLRVVHIPEGLHHFFFRQDDGLSHSIFSMQAQCYALSPCKSILCSRQGSVNEKQ